MNSEAFNKLYNQTCEGLKELLDVAVDDLIVWSVDCNGYGDTLPIESARKFGSNTNTGSVIITQDHGAFLKIRGQCWVRTGIGESKAVLRDADLIRILLSEQGYVATLLNSE